MFRGFHRPGQGFKLLFVMRRHNGKTATGRPGTAQLKIEGEEIYGIITQASQKEVEQSKQSGHPITHTIVQHGTMNQAKPTDVIAIPNTTRKFLVQSVRDPGELGHFTVYKVEERVDIK